jgi:hypothetical protein
LVTLNSSTPDHAQKNGDDGNYQQNMDQTSGIIAKKSDGPYDN